MIRKTGTNQDPTLILPGAPIFAFSSLCYVNGKMVHSNGH